MNAILCSGCPTQRVFARSALESDATVTPSPIRPLSADYVTRLPAVIGTAIAFVFFYPETVYAFRSDYHAPNTGLEGLINALPGAIAFIWLLWTWGNGVVTGTSRLWPFVLLFGGSGLLLLDTRRFQWVGWLLILTVGGIIYLRNKYEKPKSPFQDQREANTTEKQYSTSDANASELAQNNSLPDHASTGIAIPSGAKASSHPIEKVASVIILTLQQYEDGPWWARAFPLKDAVECLRSIGKYPPEYSEYLVISKVHVNGAEIAGMFYDKGVEPLAESIESSRVDAISDVEAKLRSAGIKEPYYS